MYVYIIIFIISVSYNVLLLHWCLADDRRAAPILLLFGVSSSPARPPAGRLTCVRAKYAAAH